MVKKYMEKTKARISELDIFRGFAAIAVVLFHFTYGYDNSVSDIQSDKFYFRYGYLGVHLFFIISGFVIFMTLEKTKKPLDFIVSRFSRLYPAYWAAIIITIISTIILQVPFQKNIYTFQQVAINFTMFQSFFKIKDIDGAYWTLAVELTFYFIMLVLFILKKINKIFIISLFWMFLTVLFNTIEIPIGKYLKIILILNYAPLFIAGISFFKLKTNKNNKKYHFVVILSFVVELFMLYNKNSNILCYFIIFLFYVLFYLFINDKLKVINNPFLIFFGSISYSLYLIHETIGTAIIYWLKFVIDSQFFYVPTTFLIVVLLATFITKWIEKPSLIFIRRWYTDNKKLK